MSVQNDTNTFVKKINIGVIKLVFNAHRIVNVPHLVVVQRSIAKQIKYQLRHKVLNLVLIALKDVRNVLRERVWLLLNVQNVQMTIN